MSYPYPWIKDTQNLIPPVTGYLAVTSPNGLYMVDPTDSNHYTAFGIDTLNLDGTSHTWQSIVAGGSIPSLDQVLITGSNAGSSSIDMNNNNIVNINSAITTNNSLLAPQKVDMLTAPGVVPSTNLDLNMRYVACNTGAVPTWVNSGVADFGLGVENVRASVTSFASAWWVGTESGNLWYSYDGGASWNLQHSFGGFINCLSVYNNGNFLAVGGNFTANDGNDYYNIAGVDAGLSMFDITPGYKGVNAEVKCFFDYSGVKCLYVGGSFTDFNGGSGLSYNTYAFFTFDYNTNTWYNALNHYGGGYVDNGGGVGVVNAISRDIATGYILVGGDFTQVYTNSGTQTTPYLFIYYTSNGYDAANFYPYGATGFNAPVNALLDYNVGGTLVGGDFTNLGSFLYSHGVLIVWNGSNNQWDISAYPFAGSGYISSITQPQGVSTDIYTIWSGINIYQNSTALPAIPVGTAWSCIAWNGTSILYATNAQSSATFNFYILSTVAAINLTSVYPIKQYSTISYNNITLLAAGSSIELIWNGTKSEWYILSYQGASFS